MATHRPNSGPHHHLELYLANTQYVLDMFKQGNVSEVEAINLHTEHAVALQVALTEAFVIRLTNLRSFRTPRGLDLPATGGQ